ncbi:MAG: acyl carrier protein [Lentisphaeria bacterium]|nr:acyl carrier protein [Lentisphaeria bacterium]
MMADELKTRIKTMMVDRLFMPMDPADIEDDKSLVTEYGVDSLNLLELVVGVEEEFGVRIGDTEFRVSNFETVDALAAFIEEKIN